MTTNIHQKIQTRLGTHLLAPNKLAKTKPPKYNKLQNQKQDYSIHTINIPTYHKLDLLKDSRSKYLFTFISNSSLLQPTFIKQRVTIFNLYSKMHYCFGLTFQSLFLAIDLFDTFITKYKGQLPPIQITHISLACFMIAIKYQQVYPPSLDQIQSKMKLRLNFYQYVQLEFKILNTLEFNLNLQSPIQYFQYFPCQLNQQKKSYIYLYLELACINHQIKYQYNWKVVTQALQMLFKPLAQTLNYCLPTNVEQCLKKMVVQRGKLDQCYIWLNKKYSDAKFHCMAFKSCYIGSDL